MSIRDDLHELVDRLDDADATVALSYLRRMVGDGSLSAVVDDPLERRMGPLAVSGREFAAMMTPLNLAELARTGCGSCNRPQAVQG